MRPSSLLGHVDQVSGAEIRVALEESTRSGLLFVNGRPYHVAQVGGFVRIPLGLLDAIGIVSQAGSTPESSTDEDGNGRMWMTVQLIGHGSRSGSFSRGLAQLPSIGDEVHVMTEADLQSVYGVPDSLNHVAIGHVASASAIPALIEINRLVTHHSAVVGATGAGKSTTVARILESLTDSARYPSARVVVFDIHGEYSSALQQQGHVFRVDADEAKDARPLHVPYWALPYEEFVELAFGALPDDASRGAVQDMVVRLKRDALERYPREGIKPQDVTVDTPIPFSVHQLWFDLHREVYATHSIGQSGQSHETEQLELDDKSKPVEPGDALKVTAPRYKPATQAKDQTKIFLSASRLNIRRQIDALASRLRDPRFDFLFRPGDFSPDVDGKISADLDIFLRDWIGGERTISILDLSAVPRAILNELVAALTRVLYESLLWSRRLSEGGRERPLLFVFEEAHAYLSGTGSGAIHTAVQRVVKEGRKYGVGAMIVSQRPSEVDPTILSQCGTVIALRSTNGRDRQHIVSAVADNLADVLSLLPVLRTGEAIVVGEAVALPMRVLVDRPRDLPDSSDPPIVGDGAPGGWDRSHDEPIDYVDVTVRWRSQNPTSGRIHVS